MDEEITFTFSFVFNKWELVAYAMLGGAAMMVLIGLVSYKFDLIKLIKEKM